MSGGGKGAKSAKAPDYMALAQQQGAINQQTAQQLTQANRPNQYDAFGNSITWNQVASPQQAEAQKNLEYWTNFVNGGPITDGRQRRPEDVAWARSHQLADAQSAVQSAGQGTWEQHQNLNPETKAAWENYMKNANQAASSYGDILNKYLGNYSQGPGLGQFSSGAQNFQSDAQDLKDYNDPEFNGDSVAAALYGSVMDRGRKEQQRQSDSLTNQLRNTGLVPGSEAYDRAMRNLLTSQNDANLLASQNATLAGANEGRSKYASYLSGRGQQFGQDLSANAQQFGNDANTYAQNANTYQVNRNQPLQELAGMAGIAGGSPYSPTYQGFSGATGYNPTDLLGAAQAQYGAKQAGANASNSKKGGLLGAGASLGGAFLGGK